MNQKHETISAPRERVAVLGARGFIGQALVNALLARNHRVIAFDRDWAGCPANEDERVVRFEGNARDLDDLKAAFRGCAVVYFLVYDGVPLQDSVDHLREYSRNLQMLCATMSAAKYSAIRRIVFISSGGTVYGPEVQLPIKEDSELAPMSHYGAVKMLQEELLRSYGNLERQFDCVIARLSNPFGYGQVDARRKGLIVTMLLCAAQGRPVSIYGDGSQVRDYIYIDDAIEALIALGGADGAANQTFNVGSGQGHSISEIADRIEQVCGVRLAREIVPARTQDVPANILSIDKIRKVTGWEPAYGFDAGVAELWKKFETTGPAG